MKLIIAMIQPHKLTDVKQALYEAEVHKMTVTNALGCGQQMGYTETYRGVMQEVNLSAARCVECNSVLFNTDTEYKVFCIDVEDFVAVYQKACIVIAVIVGASKAASHDTCCIEAAVNIIYSVVFYFCIFFKSKVTTGI